MSKGSNRRPTLVDSKVYKDNWSRIFNKEKTNPSGSQAVEKNGKTRQKQTEKA